jgi:dolichyl-phosphate beta-glucosyltransferase
MSGHSPLFSLIIPVYNEAERIASLPSISHFLSKLPIAHELIVVNDGSTDATLDQLKKLQSKIKFSLISYPQNRGKGFAIRAGMNQAKGDWRGFMDVDLSVPLPTLHQVLTNVTKASIIIGTRRHHQAQITQAQPKARETMGSLFTHFARTFLRVPVSDFTCGFKFFRQDAATDIFPKLKVDRWSFDPELLFVAHRRGWSIHELPVEWHNDARTKVRFPQDALRSLHELWLIRYHHWLGQYR